LSTRVQLGRSTTIIYGVHPVVETLKAGKRRVEAIYLAKEPPGDSDLSDLLLASGVAVSLVSGPRLVSLAGTPHHQGVAARVEPFPYTDLTDVLSESAVGREVLLILDEIQDPANLGSILRSAECLGSAGVIIGKDRAVSITPSVEKASAGASAHVPVARTVNLARTIEQVKAAGYWVYAAEMEAGEICYEVDLTGKIAFVLGSEGKGLRRLVRQQCDREISIPLVGKIDSLNVAQTAAILLAESFRQRVLGTAASKNTLGK